MLSTMFLILAIVGAWNHWHIWVIVLLALGVGMKVRYNS